MTGDGTGKRGRLNRKTNRKVMGKTAVRKEQLMY